MAKAKKKKNKKRRRIKIILYLEFRRWKEKKYVKHEITDAQQSAWIQKKWIVITTKNRLFPIESVIAADQVDTISSKEADICGKYFRHQNICQSHEKEMKLKMLCDSCMCWYDTKPISLQWNFRIVCIVVYKMHVPCALCMMHNTALSSVLNFFFLKRSESFSVLI